jgi:hypothetical protein
MPLSRLEIELRLLARERIAQGQLPRTVPERIWGGKGTGRACALCDKPIEEMELEVEEHIAGELQIFHFHVLCQSLWQLECVRAYHLRKDVKSTA